jgi:outer membrane protein
MKIPLSGSPPARQPRTCLSALWRSPSFFVACEAAVRLPVRPLISLTLCACLAAPMFPQQIGIEPIRPQGHTYQRPYRPVEVPPVRLSNGTRMAELLRAGKLYLTAQDAIEIALENNIDIEIARYNKTASEWQLERVQAGGALAGVPSSASQAFSVAAGQGVQGSQSSAGVSGGGGNGTGNNSSNASVSQVGPVTAVLDPSVQETTTFGHQTTPQQNTTQSLTQALISNTRAFSGTYQQGFLSGGQVSASLRYNYLNENSPTDVLNPSAAVSLSVSAQQNLLRGFGTSVNGRNIEVAKVNVGTSDLNFKTQVTGLVVNVLDNYYALVADYEDLRAKTSARDVALQFYDDTKKQLEFGALTPLDVTNAESQLVASRQNLDISQTSLQQQELQLLNLLSRTGIADPLLAGVRIVPLDHIEIPAADELPPLKDLIDQAMANRSDLAAAQAAIKTAEISAIGTRNGILPTGVVFTTQTQSGLAGNAKPLIVINPATGKPVVALSPDAYFVGGTGTALGQVFRRNFPSESAGGALLGAIGNHQAQADFGIEQLQLRQRQLTTQKDRNQAQVDVLNAVIALQQSRAKYEAAMRSRILNQQLLSAEQQKYSLGASTPYLVVQQQRDLVNANSAEIAALAAYSNARIALEQATGTTLETHHVSIADVRTGKIPTKPALPATLPQ